MCIIILLVFILHSNEFTFYFLDLKMGFPGVWKILYYFLRVLHMTVNNFMAIPAYVTWYILLTPLRHFYPPLYWQIERILFKALLSFVVMWTNSGGYKSK
jgi:hypothetical protein